MKTKLTKEVIEEFLNGKYVEEKIVSVEWDKNTETIIKIIEDNINGKKVKREKLKPFCWIKQLPEGLFYKGDKTKLKKAMREFGISVKKLRTDNVERLENGFKYLIQSEKGFRELQNFFNFGGLNWFNSKEYLFALKPIEMWFIQNGVRIFKGMEEYNDVHRLVFDIETTGLDPETDEIFLIGIKDNRNYEKLLSRDEMSEGELIITFFHEILNLKPSIIAGYNSANFDWPFILRRAEINGIDVETLIKLFNDKLSFSITKENLKLGNEVEEYEQVNIFGFNIIDTYHAVRKAMAINSNIKSGKLKDITKQSKINKVNRVYIKGDKIGELWEKNETYYFNNENGEYFLEKPENFENFEIVDGKYIVKRYLMDDLWETLEVDNIYNQSSFLLAKLIPGLFQRISTMGTASLWKQLMLSWSYENNLAIPEKESKRDFIGGLSRLCQVGYSGNIVKLDYSSLYPSIQLTHDIFPDVDIDGIMKELLKHFYAERNHYKGLMKLAAKENNSKLETFYDRKQLPIKILNNSMYGSLTAPNVFPWSDLNKGEKITCIGRQYLRLMIYFFRKKGFQPIVLDTDGVNFSHSDFNKMSSYEYIGEGFSDKVVKDKLYKGVDAYIAEYNDLYMRDYMGLSLDGIATSTINLSRKNYANLEPDGKVKLTGNTIKSKKMPQYIEDFLDKGIRLLLENKGSEFVDYYYEYFNLIYDKKIPLLKIATKAKVKSTIDAYIERSFKTNVKGNALPKQAHMELAMKHKLDVKLGDTLYYVNNGTKASHGDIEYSYLILPDDVENNPNQLGEYNVARSISIFNKRIEPLLICFHPNVRNQILIKNPDDKKIFTKTQLELVSGFPDKESDQDKVEDILTPEEREINYWKQFNYNPVRFNGTYFKLRKILNLNVHLNIPNS